LAGPYEDWQSLGGNPTPGQNCSQPLLPDATLPKQPSDAGRGVQELQQPGAGSLVRRVLTDPGSPLPSQDRNTNVLGHERQKEPYHPLVAPPLLTWPAPAER